MEAGAGYAVPAVLALVSVGANIASKAVGYIPAPQAKVASAALWVIGWGSGALAGGLGLATAVAP